MDEIISTSGDRQRLPSAVQEIIRQELVNKLEAQLQEEEAKSEEPSATESEDEANRQECDDDYICLRTSNSCLRRSRNSRWSPLGSPLVRSPARSPKNSTGRAFLASSAPMGIQQCRSPRSSPELTTFITPTSSIVSEPRIPIPAGVTELTLPRTSSRPTSPKPRRKELYTDLDLEAVHNSSMDVCYSPKRNFLAQTVQF